MPDDSLHVDGGAEAAAEICESEDAFHVWWRTLKEVDHTLTYGDPVNLKPAIKHYRDLFAKHIEMGYPCSGLHFTTKAERASAEMGLPAPRRKTQECRVITCPACWHRRQRSAGTAVHRTVAPYWYVSHTNTVPVTQPMHPKVLTRLLGSGHRFKPIAWNIVALVDQDNLDHITNQVGRRHVLIATGEQLYESNRPDVISEGAVVGSVVRKCFKDRNEAYHSWVDLNDHPGPVLTHDNAHQQCAVLDYQYAGLNKSFISRGLA